MVVVGKQMTSDQELRLMRGGVVLQSGAIEGKVFLHLPFLMMIKPKLRNFWSRFRFIFSSYILSP